MSDAPDRFIVLTPDALGLGIGPNREVVVSLRGLEKKAGLVPGLGVMIAMSPTEARQFAESLLSVHPETPVFKEG